MFLYIQLAHDANSGQAANEINCGLHNDNMATATNTNVNTSSNCVVVVLCMQVYWLYLETTHVIATTITY